MRTRAIAVTAVLLLATLAACGTDDGSGDSKADAKPAAASPTPPPAAVDPTVKYLADVHAAAFPSWDNTAPTDSELTAFPPDWCQALDAGHSVTYILDQEDLYPIGQTWGTKKEDAEQLVVLGVSSYCPTHRAAVVDELRAAGAY
ncbi:hypothetical protein HY68_36500 [Streptomyces sp. AcH 505]|uniref:DUF732 domain-containing protein n=1 Tax=Streptomyces sp. AcH 505 TaxID=352211 RepID=UPI000591D5DB|nr:hypothetical protein HY68_36500 [Streptomyces sp. AcH 505]